MGERRLSRPFIKRSDVRRNRPFPRPGEKRRCDEEPVELSRRIFNLRRPPPTGSSPEPCVAHTLAERHRYVEQAVTESAPLARCADTRCRVRDLYRQPLITPDATQSLD